jgi:hypothetical protein
VTKASRPDSKNTSVVRRVAVVALTMTMPGHYVALAQQTLADTVERADSAIRFLHLAPEAAKQRFQPLACMGLFLESPPAREVARRQRQGEQALRGLERLCRSHRAQLLRAHLRECDAGGSPGRDPPLLGL